MDTQPETTASSFVYNRIPTKVSRKDFNRYIEPHLHRPKKGPKPKLSLYKIFNYILYVFIGKYLSCLRKLDCVIIFKAGFETQLRASRLSISFGMSALGMACQIRNGRLQGGIQPDHVATLQGLDEVA